MNTRLASMAGWLLGCVVLCLPLHALPAEPAPPSWQPNVATLENSRALAQTLGTQLKTALMEAMAEGGAVAAISVCRDRAPQIAAALSRQSGAKIGRTSHRYRNPQNAPEPWQAEVLDTQFAGVQAGAAGQVEYFVSDAAGGVRYMHAIYLQPLCATCHGETLSPDVQQAVSRDYPHDEATGFSIGALRGAFTVMWPAAAGSPGPASP